MNIKKALPAIIIFALLATGVAYAGYRYVQVKNAANYKESGQWQNRDKNKNAGMRRSGGMVAGKIAARGTDNLTIELSEGGSKIVFFSDVTKVTSYSDITAADLMVGDEVVVIGNKTDAGGITAVSVQLGAALNGDFGPGGAARQNAEPDEQKNGNNGRGAGAQNMDFTAGQITATDDNGITIKTGDGAEKSIALAETTKYSKISDSSVMDLADGMIIVVSGKSNTDGSITAQSIQIRPELPAIPKQDRLQNAPQKNITGGQNNQGGLRQMPPGGVGRMDFDR